MIIFICALALAVSGCDYAISEAEETYTTPATYYNPYTDIYEPPLTLPQYEESGYDAILATPVQLPVYVNETLYSVPAFYIEGQHYFYLRDIAHILQGTLAEFWLSLHSPYSPVRIMGIDGERYGCPLTPTIWEILPSWDMGYVPALRPLPSDAKLATPITSYFNNQSWLAGGAFGIVYPMAAFEIDNRLFIDLWQIGRAMGVDICTTAGTIYINTHQPYISEYGRRVVEEFINSFLENDNYYKHEYSVLGHRLYDLDGSGIPAVVLTKGREMSRWNNQTIYMYVPGGPGFVAVGEIGLHIFYRSEHDKIFMYSGDLGMYSGLFGCFYSVEIYENGLRFQPLICEKWDADSFYPSFYIGSTLAEMSEDELADFLQQFPMPTMPDTGEPLYRIRSFTFE